MVLRALALSTEQHLFQSRMVWLPRLADCCACASLRTGTLLIGGLNLAACIIMMLVSFTLMAGSSAIVTTMAEILDENVPGWRGDISTAGLEYGRWRPTLLSSFTTHLIRMQSGLSSPPPPLFSSPPPQGF